MCRIKFICIVLNFWWVFIKWHIWCVSRSTFSSKKKNLFFLHSPWPGVQWWKIVYLIPCIFFFKFFNECSVSFPSKLLGNYNMNDIFGMRFSIWMRSRRLFNRISFFFSWWLSELIVYEYKLFNGTMNESK